MVQHLNPPLKVLHLLERIEQSCMSLNDFLPQVPSFLPSIGNFSAQAIKVFRPLVKRKDKGEWLAKFTIMEPLSHSGPSTLYRSSLNRS
jgi:hypothetical protein